ncbi:unnamed protein product [Diamesa serratosioi]
MKIDKYVEESNVIPDCSIKGVSLNLGTQFNSWKKGLIAEAGESPLKPLINEVGFRKKMSDKKMDTADELMDRVSDAEKDFDLSFTEFCQSMENSNDNLVDLNTSLNSLIGSSVELEEILNSAKDLIEKETN